ncbi:MAG: peptide-methionine (R)-S-oxide reductase MsrB [Pseudomonadota bacterium]
MKRRKLMFSLAALTTTALVTSANVWAHLIDSGKKIIKLDKSMKEWKSLLSADQYDILFEESTEAPGSSPLNNIKERGTYICAACFLPLFQSETKYDSGTGWPSFYQAIEGRVGTKLDLKLIWPRTEYHCIRCGGHQGHVFDDGPQPTGLRYCNNGLALEFVPESKPLPKLRS